MIKLILVFLTVVSVAVGRVQFGLFKKSPEWDAFKAGWSLPKALPRMPTGYVKVGLKKIASKVSKNGANNVEKMWNLLTAVPGTALQAIMPKFNQFPRTVDEAMKQSKSGVEWKSIDRTCYNQNYLGYRYLYTYKDKKTGEQKYDMTIILLMDHEGHIVGVQSGVDDPHFVPTSPLMNKYYLKNNIGNEGYWTQTAYFVDPGSICKGNHRDPAVDGTGNGLWIQRGQIVPNSDTFNNFHVIPMDENTPKSGNEWGNGKCFPTMGQHYFHSMPPGNTEVCTDFVPFFLLYNHGELTGFGMLKNTIIPESSRFDYPSPSNKDFKKFMKEVPQCFYKDPSYQTLRAIHFYFKKNAEYRSTC